MTGVVIQLHWNTERLEYKEITNWGKWKSTTKRAKQKAIC